MKRTALVVDYDTSCIQVEAKVIPNFLKHNWGLAQYHQRDVDYKSFDKENPPDIIIHYYHTNAGYKHYMFWEKIKAAWGDAPFLLCVTGEARNIARGIADMTISYMPDDENNMHLNQTFWEASFELSKLFKTKSAKLLTAEQAGITFDYLEILDRFRDRPKERFCHFIQRNRKSKYPGVVNRMKLCKELAKYKRIDCPGKAMNNTQELMRLEAHYKKNYKKPPIERVYSEYWHIAKFDYMSHYKFSLTGENQIAPGYITEKIVFSLLAGCIPIYWGTPEITQYVNSGCFINCNDYDSFVEVAARVKEIDQDPQLYQEYLDAPVFPQDSLFYDIDWDKVLPKFDRIKKRFDQHYELRQEKSTAANINPKEGLRSYLRYRNYRKQYYEF